MGLVGPCPSLRGAQRRRNPLNALDCFASLAMTSKGQRMTDDTKTDAAGIPSLEDWQHWTLVMGRAQQMLMESWADGLRRASGHAASPAWGAFRRRSASARAGRRADRPDGADDRRRAGLGEGARGLGQDARRSTAASEGGGARTAASPRPNGARTRSSTPSARPICAVRPAARHRSTRSRASTRTTRAEAASSRPGASSTR